MHRFRIPRCNKPNRYFHLDAAPASLSVAPLLILSVPPLITTSCSFLGIGMRMLRGGILMLLLLLLLRMASSTFAIATQH